MTLEEILKSQGLTDEQIQTITGEMKQNKIFTAAEENLDIRYGKLKTDSEAQKAELEKANGLIAELQKASKGNADALAQIDQYKAEVEQLQKELQQQKIDAAVKVGLLAEHALDVDYLSFKLREDGDLELTDKGDIKGWTDKVAGLKTKFPTQFEGDKQKQIEPNKLPQGDPEPKPAEPKSLADALQQHYDAPKD